MISFEVFVLENEDGSRTIQIVVTDVDQMVEIKMDLTPLELEHLGHQMIVTAQEALQPSVDANGAAA